MSSQGPVGDPAIDKADPPFCTGPTGGFPYQSAGPKFNLGAIRDASDWIAYKKQNLIRKEDKSKINQDPWFSHGNDYRIQYQMGVYKSGAEGCTGCDSGVFGSTGPY